jgi:hypothetical protein
MNETYVKQLFLEIFEEIAQQIVADKRFDLLFNAYNTWRENEADGIDYFFDATNEKNVEWCLENGLSKTKFDKMQAKHKARNTKYFMWDDAHLTPCILTDKEVEEWLESAATEIVKWVFTYPDTGAYKAIYDAYVSDIPLYTTIPIERESSPMKLVK